MKRLSSLALVGVWLLIVGCAGSQPSPEMGGTDTSASLPGPTATASTVVSSTPNLGASEEPPEFTEFTSSTACDPAADDANLQVVQAFVNAYNDRDEGRLAELFSDSVTVDDLSGYPTSDRTAGRRSERGRMKDGRLTTDSS
jgi:hypothetical protein